MTSLVDGALVEFNRYLQGEVQPNGGANALAVLMAQPPDVLMQQVANWAAEKHRTQHISIRDLLVFALQKIYITGELDLLDRVAVANYLDRITGVALRICPPEERDDLRMNITSMRVSRVTTATQSQLTPIPKVAGPVVSAEEAHAAKQYSMIYDRLTREMATAGPQAAQDPQAIAQLLAMAATRSQTGQQLNQYLEQLRPIAGKEGNVFVILGGAMPSWDMPNMAPGSGKPPSQVNAMEKIIDLAESPAVTMQRFREIVTAAVQKFNDGSLAAAVWMLDVAEDTITEKKLDLSTVNQIREAAVDAISAVQLRKYTENKPKHAAVRIVLGFFPTLKLEVLFPQLRGQKIAERRRILLGFIEAYGTKGRDFGLEELEREVQRSDVDTYYLRNLIYILHRTARENDDTVDREFAALEKASAPGQNVYVQKEAATALGQFKNDRAAKLLTVRLAECEAALLRPDAGQQNVAEMQKLLDRIAGSLTRIGTTSALLTVARHGMKTNPQLGDTRARLSSLAQHDLSFDQPTIDVLLKALRDEIPGKLLGRLMPKKQDATVRLIEALSGTRSEDIEEVFVDIASRFPDQDVGRAAAKVTEKWSPPQPAAARNEPPATFTGELEFFGLPSVMQALADQRATGMLTLNNKRKEAAAKLVFVEGRFVNAQTGHVKGLDAVYQALEKPVAGSFAFVPYPAERMKSDLPPLEVMGLLLEGVRRNDELQRLTAIVPDSMIVAKTDMKPAPHEEEDDPALIREVWLKAATGTPVSDWERQIPVDVYRVRRLVAHWLEQGALVAK